MNSRKLKRVILGLFLAFIAICVVVAGMFVGDSFVYNPDTVAASCMESNSKVTVRSEAGYRIFEPESDIIAKVIFYPASLVEFRAYAPLMQEFASRGILSIACKMTADLVILGKDKAEGALELYPEIENCYIAGHGYGGTAASAYAAKHADEFDGVILLAAKPSKKLADTQLSCLSIYGDCDGKISEKEYEKYSKYYPADTVEFVIEGANNSQFGSFGTFSGDEIAEISAEEQLRITADKVAEFIENTVENDKVSEKEISEETLTEETTGEATTVAEESTTEEPTTEEETTKKSKKTEEATKKSKKTEEETTKKNKSEKSVEETTTKKVNNKKTKTD